MNVHTYVQCKLQKSWFIRNNERGIGVVLTFTFLQNLASLFFTSDVVMSFKVYV